MRLQFLGANRQVTGSRYLLEAAGKHVMIGCGMFQERPYQERNWDTSPVDPKSVDVLLLTHAHLDHVGLVPRLVAQGFKGPIITTEPTVDLAKIIMTDSAKLQEEDVAYKKKRHERKGRKSPHPYVPLYTIDDAEKAVTLFRGERYKTPVKLGDNLSATFHEAGHILGSACIEIRATENGSTKTLLFSGDLGQRDKPFIGDPSQFNQADFIVMESTYGDRNHRDAGPVEEQLAKVVNDTYQRGGNLVIPTFALERAQELIYHFGRLMNEGFVPRMPVYLDSPMAVDVTEVFRKYHDWMDDEMRAMLQSGYTPLKFDGLKMTRTTEESKAINDVKEPIIILAGSGMCNGGRIKHHLRHNVTRKEATILFVGFQSYGTLGRRLVDGEDDVRIHGEHHPVKCKVAQIAGLSAHADRNDLLQWVAHFKKPPTHLFLTHGEERAAMSLADAIRSQRKWDVSVPEYHSAADLA